MADNLNITPGAGAVLRTTEAGGVHTTHHTDTDRAALIAAIGAVTTALTAPLAVVGRATLASATFSRPANTTAYVSGQLAANSVTAGSVTPMSFTVARIAAGSGMIRRLRIRKTGTSITNASFRLHLFTASPVPSNGDGAAFLTDKAMNYMGKIDVTMDQVFTDGSTGNGVPFVGSEINFALTSGQVIFGLLEARGSYTPVSGETFNFELEVLPN